MTMFKQVSPNKLLQTFKLEFSNTFYHVKNALKSLERQHEDFLNFLLKAFAFQRRKIEKMSFQKNEVFEKLKILKFEIRFFNRQSIFPFFSKMRTIGRL